MENWIVQTVASPRPFAFLSILPLLLCLGLGLAGCGLGDAKYPKPRYQHTGTPDYGQPSSSPAFGYEGSDSTDGGATVIGPIGADNPVWRAALEEVSFMPLISADATKGIIVTDWYSTPGAPDQRQKVTIRVLGREVRPQSLSVAMVREQRGADGTWTSVPSTDAVTEFAHEILTRAHQA
ncbi:MAG TPA: DUF3576 domain-containing protein [Candidatus Acidoferrum sp.]|nr:DUF3576 domain-containing protein [Candidatus Acidoferrum sp.]